MNKCTVYGFPRSGSTYVNNVVCQILERKLSFQKHFFENRDTKNEKIILTYRDFRDCAVSWWRKDVGRFSENQKAKRIPANCKKFPIIQRKLKTHEESLRLLLEMSKHNNNILLLKYEDFVFNQNFLLESLEDFLEIEVSEENKKLIEENLSIEALKKDLKEKKIRRFDERGFHKMHVFKGMPETYKELLDKNQVKKLTNNFKEELIRWGYEL